MAQTLSRHRACKIAGACYEPSHQEPLATRAANLLWREHLADPLSVTQAGAAHCLGRQSRLLVLRAMACDLALVRRPGSPPFAARAWPDLFTVDGRPVAGACHADRDAAAFAMGFGD